MMLFRQTFFPHALAALTLASLSACGDRSNSDTPFTVNAGEDIAVEEGATVGLSAVIAGAEGQVTMEWSQVLGPMVEFVSTGIVSPEVILPRVTEDTGVVLRLTVTDEQGTTSDEMVITIADVSNGPEGRSSQGITDEERAARRARARETRIMAASREVRTYDGSGNNVDNPAWGSAFSHLQRIGTASYADGISELAGADRLSARAVSNAVVNQVEGVSVPNTFNRTDMVWQWGQFLDHDIDLTDGAEEEANIVVPAGDAEFDPAGTGTAVIPFSRALFDPATGTSLDNPREQENEITSWIDGSQVYGSDTNRALALRVAADSPFLATSAGNLLPFNADELPNANGFVPDATSLFLAGDVRANEQVGLATMHTLWVREHNRIAQRLLDVNFSDDTEVVFQQARRLVIAKLQKITYEEFLPALTGTGGLAAYDGYDASVNPTIYNEFSAAAFRFGHSLINQQLLRLDASGNEIPEGHLSLREAFFTAPSVLIEETSIDPILRGLATQPHQAVDTQVIQDLRNFLFGAPGDGGLDLPSLNIQRGRDHGLPSYNDMRVAIGLARYTSFDQITKDVDVQLALSNSCQGDIDKIDLWVGGLAEDAIGDSQFGELLSAIILRQFDELRSGDRFWYERDLTESELRRLENVTLRTIIMDNTSIGNELQENVFMLP